MEDISNATMTSFGAMLLTDTGKHQGFIIPGKICSKYQNDFEFNNFYFILFYVQDNNESYTQKN